MGPYSPALLTRPLIPPGSQRDCFSYSLARPTANKNPGLSTRLGFPPIGVQNFSLLTASWLSEKGGKPP